MPDTYIPILRNGRNEPQVIRNFDQSSLSGSSPRSLSMTPLIEVTDEDDIDDLGTYRAAGAPVLVELPRYLTQRANRFNDPVSNLIAEHGSVEEFYGNNADQINVPVVSGPIEPVDYSVYRPRVERLRDDFDRVAVRLMLLDFNDALTSDQRESLESLAKVIGGTDFALFDLVDNGVTDEIEGDLAYLTDLFSEATTGVLNGFDAYNAHPDNESPRLANENDAEAFGDFGINQRFKPDGGGQPEEVQIRHYHPNNATIQFFAGNDYEEAADELTEWDEWDRAHCDGCRRADRTTSYDTNTWAQIKLEHYLSSVLRGEI